LGRRGTNAVQFHITSDGIPEKNNSLGLTAVQGRMTACNSEVRPEKDEANGSDGSLNKDGSHGNPEKDAPTRMITVQRKMTAYSCDCSQGMMHLQE
jgi:hypothetical protein